MDKPHKPIKYVDVTVNTDIDIIQTLGIRQVLFKILHIGDEQVLVTFEIFIHFLVFVTNMDDDLTAVYIVSH